MGEGPKLAPIANQQTEFMTPIDVTVSLEEDEAAAPFILVKAKVLVGDLVPDSGLVINGTGKDRTLTITPASVGTGSTIITVTASDALGRSNSRSFVLTVTGPFDEVYPQVKSLVSGQEEYFGARVAIQGDYALFGAPRNGNQHFLAGAVYAYRLLDGAWLGFQQLSASDASAISGFGSAVAMSGDYAIVGAAYKADGTGAAYVFKRSGNSWSEVAKLAASDGQPGDQFGIAVAIDGATAVVGASAIDGLIDSDGAGAAYVYTRSGESWSEVGRLAAPSAADGDGFGAAVAISGSYLAVGAPGGTSPGSTNSGSAYLFRRVAQDWNYWQALNPVDTVQIGAFGSAIAITHRPLNPPLTADYVLVGAPTTEGGGAVYSFLRLGDIWPQASKLAAPDSHQGNRFGNALAFDGPRGVIGAYLENLGAPGPPSGGAYLFEQVGGTWSAVNRLTSPANQTGEEFAYAVAISGAHVAIGAPGNRVGGLTDVGTVYVFHD